MRALFLAFIAAFFAVSCSKSTEGLGNGTFNYACVSAPSGGCGSGAGSIVPGTRFTMSYTPNDPSSFPDAKVTPVSLDYIAIESDGSFVALQPGSPALYAMSRGLVLDYTTLKVPVPASGAATTDGGR